MHKQMMKKLMAYVLTMALSCSVFMGTSITGNATSVSGNEVTGDENPVEQQEVGTVSENEIPDANVTPNNEEALNNEEPVMMTLRAGNSSSLVAPTNVKWSEPGVISFVLQNPTPAFHYIEIEKDGCKENCIRTSNLLEWNKVGDTITYDIFTDIEESGTYRFRIKVSESEDAWDIETDCMSGYSEDFVYTLPDAKLQTPTNVRWSATKAGLVEWDRVDNAFGYSAYLYDGNNGMVSGITHHYNDSNPHEDFSDKIGENGPYTIKVRAISKDIVNITHSDWVSVPYGSMSAIVEKVNNSLDEKVSAMENATAEQAAAVVTELQTSVAETKSDLQISMQSSGATRDKIASLEESYIEKAGITQNAPQVDATIMEPSQVKILGASLNATPGATVDFKISLPTEEDKAVINTDLYKNVLAFEMDLEGEGITSSNLAIPVCITLPVPAGMSASNIKILHYSTMGAAPEVYDSSNIRFNNDGTFSFTITHFSMFAIVEVEEVVGNSQVVVSSNDGTKQSVSSGTWVPVTPEEKKRFALMGKEPVEYVAAEGNAYPLFVTNSVQGPKCFDSFEAVLGDYTIGRTYNIFPENKVAYTMGSAAKITLSIPSALRMDGREFKMICVTENGTPYVLKDLDKNPDTITFETDKYYAFALIYK